MKVIGITEDNRITGVQYGLIEIPDAPETTPFPQTRKKTKNYQTQMKKLQNAIKNKQRVYNTHQK